MRYVAERLRISLCFFLAVCAGGCLYLGLSPLFSLRAATADDIRERRPDPGLCLDLRLDVEGVAAALAGAARDAGDAGERVRLLSASLDGLAARAAGPGRDSGACYMLWKDTRLIHSPGFPDLAGRNFFGAKDVDGRTFAAEMARAAGRGGGSVVFTPAGGKGPVLAYAMPLEVSGLHMTAHVPARFEDEARREGGPLYTAGFCLSGLSFAGLAGLCGVRRGKEPE